MLHNNSYQFCTLIENERVRKMPDENQRFDVHRSETFQIKIPFLGYVKIQKQKKS